MQSLRNLYAELLEHRDDGCPNFIESSSWTGTWEANCQASSGSNYSGTGTLLEFFGTELPYDMSLHASFELKGHDGSIWLGGGLSSFVHSMHNGEETWVNELGGSHEYQPTEPLPSNKQWMELFAASIKAQMNIRNNERSLLVHGAFSSEWSGENNSTTFTLINWIGGQSTVSLHKEASRLEILRVLVRHSLGCQKCGTILWFSEGSDATALFLSF